MPIAVGDGAHANFVAELNSQVVMTGLWFTPRTSTSDLQNLATALTPFVTSHLVPATPADVTWTEVMTFDPHRDGEATVHHALTPALPGTLTGAALPGQCTVKTRLMTGYKSARRRGGALFPGLTEESVAGGYLEDPQISLITAFYTAINSAFGSGGSNSTWSWVIYSPENLTAVPPRPGTIITPINQFSVDRLVRTVHRRQIGVGV